jgi:hypothetical protein
MDIARIKSPKAQTLTTLTSANVILSELLFEDSSGVVKANTSSGSITVSEAGYYLVIFDALVTGAGAPFIALSGNGFSAALSGIEFLQFDADATGVSKGRMVLLQMVAGADVGLFASNPSGVTLTFLCTLGVVKMADVG